MSETSKISSDMPEREARWRDHLMRWGKRATIAALLFAVLFLAFCWLTPTPEKQLAAFDAAHAVPDEDNAALIYAELLRGEEVPPSKVATAVARIEAAIRDPVSVQESRTLSRELRELELSDGISDPNAAKIIGLRPWRSADCPELRQWLDKRRNRIDKLREAARKPSCYFPLNSTPGRMGLSDVPLGALRQNAFLLRYAANNDFGEGDIDAGLAKCEVLMLMGRHFCQQPSASYLLSGIGYEAAAIHSLAEFVVEGYPTDRHLQDLAAQCQDLRDEWEGLKQDINHVRDILSRQIEDRRPIRFRISMWFYRIRTSYNGWLEDRTGELYHRVLSERRGLRILIELRRFKDRMGRWPESLDLIASSLPPEALVDPSSDAPYVYRLCEHGFLLYSAGPNRVDENGQHTEHGLDDWPIWPPRGRGPEPEPRDANGV
jgi:hypothetical protein